MGFPRKEYWRGLPFPLPGDLPDPGMELLSPALAGRFFTTESPESEVKLLSRVWLFVSQWTIASQAPLAMGFSRQDYSSGLPFPSPGDLPKPGIEPVSFFLNPGLLHCRQTLYHLSPQGSPLFYFIPSTLKSISSEFCVYNCKKKRQQQHSSYEISPQETPPLVPQWTSFRPLPSLVCPPFSVTF